MNASEAQTGQKRIEDLTVKEVDMIYSLARVGEWTELEIGKRYKISRADVRKIGDNYVELREMLEKNEHDERLLQDPSLKLSEKQRKHRSDAQYATPAERQAAYRARLQERHHAGMQVLSQPPVTDPHAPVEEELSVTTVDTP